MELMANHHLHEAIRMVREALKIPVASNGGVSSYESALRCLKETGCYLFAEGLKGVFSYASQTE